MRESHAARSRCSPRSRSPCRWPFGCGGDDDEGAAVGEKGRPAKLVVGVIPIAPVAPLYLGIDKGFFKAENLEIEPHFGEGGVTVTAAVIAGEFQAGFSNTVSLLTAAEKDLAAAGAHSGRLGRGDEG